MPAKLIASDIALLQELEHYQQQHCATGSYGAMACFIGSMRDFNAGENVSMMILEHYPQMTQSFLDVLCADSIKQWQLEDALIIHRYGELKPGDDIVLVACWSAHRAAAFNACREMMEQLKSKAPFWKKEITEQGERWVHDTTENN